MHRPPTWNSGSTVSTVSVGVMACAAAAMRMLASRLAWVCTAAFGPPVVPEVNTSKGRRIGIGVLRRGALVSCRERFQRMRGDAGGARQLQGGRRPVGVVHQVARRAIGQQPLPFGQCQPEIERHQHRRRCAPGPAAR
jgi:hypothetical protein